MKNCPLFLFIGFFTFNSFGQMSVYSDLYVGVSDELFINFPLISFESGIVFVDRNGGLLSFSENTTWENATNNAHVDGPVRSYNTNNFIFPVGHNGVFQPVMIQGESDTGVLRVAYIHDKHPEKGKTEEIYQIHPIHYWKLLSPTGSAKITLSWNLHSELISFLGDWELKDLSIGGYDGTLWHHIPSSLDERSIEANEITSVLSGSITSEEPVLFDRFSAVALVIKGGIASEDTVQTAQAFTPNGDGVNDNWIIKGIENYPDASVYVYNLFGETVFKADGGYQNDWNGNFNSYGHKLDVGTYLYAIDLDSDGNVDSKGWIYINY